MQTLPAESMILIVAFAPLFSKPDFESVKLLLDGAILAIGTPPIMACRGKSHLAGDAA